MQESAKFDLWSKKFVLWSKCLWTSVISHIISFHEEEVCSGLIPYPMEHRCVLHILCVCSRCGTPCGLNQQLPGPGRPLHLFLAISISSFIPFLALQSCSSVILVSETSSFLGVFFFSVPAHKPSFPTSQLPDTLYALKHPNFQKMFPPKSSILGHKMVKYFWKPLPLSPEFF